MTEAVEPDLTMKFFDVVKRMSKKDETTREINTCDDIQLLLLGEDPRNFGITPLKLSADFDKEKDVFSYGFGSLLAEFENKKQLGLGIKTVKTMGPGSVEKMEEKEIPLFSKVRFNHVVPNNFLNKARNFFRAVGCKIISFLPNKITCSILPLSYSDSNSELQFFAGQNASKLDTATGPGFSGGPLIQNSTVVGITSGGNVNFNLPGQKYFKYYILSRIFLSSLCVYGSPLLNLPTLLYYSAQITGALFGSSSWIWNPLVKSFFYYTELEGGSLSTVVMLDIFTAALQIKYLYTSLNNHRNFFAKVTPGLLDWIRNELKKEKNLQLDLTHIDLQRFDF